MTPAAKLAFGRILRMASRPAEPGDAAKYERCRLIILHEMPSEDRPDVSINLIRNYLAMRGDEE